MKRKNLEGVKLFNLTYLHDFQYIKMFFGMSFGISKNTLLLVKLLSLCKAISVRKEMHVTHQLIKGIM